MRYNLGSRTSKIVTINEARQGKKSAGSNYIQIVFIKSMDGELVKLVVIKRTDTFPGTTANPYFFKDVYKEGLKRVSKKVEVVVIQSEELETYILDADILAGFPMHLEAVDIKRAKKLKWMHSFSAGVDRVLTAELVRSPIIVSNSSGIHATPIAEHVIGFMLLFTRGFVTTFRNQQKHVWEKRGELVELRGKTVLVVGLGHIGSEVARLAYAFGARVLAISQSTKEKPPFVDTLKTGASLDALLAKADFVVLSLPHTKETHHLFNKTTFKRMKQSAALINIGRGGLINEDDLIEALKKKIIGGAALDVTEEEPLPEESPLWDMGNVAITPHHSGLSEKYMERAIDLLCLNLKAFLTGKLLPNVIDKRKGY